MSAPSTAVANRPTTVNTLMPFVPDLMQGGWTRGTATSPIVTSSDRPMIRVVDVGVIKPTGEFAYQQILICEEGGAAIIMFDPATHRVALRKQWRFQAPDYRAWTLAMRAGPVAMLSMIASLGRVSYEVVRGFPKDAESGAETAGREASEESEYTPVVMRLLAPVCSNTALNPHMAEVYVGECDMTAVGSDNPDPNEAFLDGTEWFDWNGLIDLKNQGLLYCGFSLAALFLLMLDDDNAFD
jgi:hypothetical protein